ncbi:MAG TPA: hypothetical protein VNG51_23610 [Ktedonobacteraceae bacterium]|nr:hypothetical protein [Ktedonobacteraceae bacterium]
MVKKLLPGKRRHSVNCPGGEIDLYNVYITPFNHKERTLTGERKLYPWLKFDLLSGIYQTLSAPTDRPRVLCGDFNTPREEMPDGTIITWGYSGRNGKYFLTPAGQYQHEVEHNILYGLGEHCGMPDAYRRFHGYGTCDADEGGMELADAHRQKVPLRSHFCLKDIVRTGHPIFAQHTPT